MLFMIACVLRCGVVIVDGICAWHTDTTLHNGMDGVQCGLDGILYRCDDEEFFHSEIVF